MRKHRSRFGGKRRRLNRGSRPTGFIAKRLSLASPELLELRTYLSGAAPLDPVAWYGSFSARSILASSISAGAQSTTAQPPAVAQATATTSSSATAVDSLFSVQAVAAASPTPTLAPQADSNDPILEPLVGEVIEYTVRIEDLSGNPNPTIMAGQDFQIEVEVQDIRDPVNPIPAVFGAYVVVEFDNTVATVSAGAEPEFGPTFAAFGDGGEFVVSSNGTTTQIVAGSFFPFGGGAVQPTTNAVQLLYRIQMHAVAAGDLTFTSSFDTGLGHDTLLYNPPDEQPPSAILFGSDSISVVDLPTVTVTGGAAAETNSGTTSVPFTVNLSAASDEQVTVQYTTADGTGANAATAADLDYVAQSDTLTFAPGVTTTVVNVLVNGDGTNEPDETFSLALSAPVNTIIGATTPATITNDDTPVSITSNVEHGEGNAPGTTDFIFTVTLANPTALQVTVPFNTVDGTGTGGATTANNDYIGQAGVLTFAANTPVLTQLITVVVNGDATNELNESFSVVLGTPTNAAIAPGLGTGTGTITNDDGPRISFVGGTKVVQQAETNAGETSFVFEVSSGVADPGLVSVEYTVVDGTGPNGARGAASGAFAADYTPTSGTLTFAPNTTENQFITVKVKGDTVNEADETFSILLSGEVNATLTDTSATGIIQNDDDITFGFEPGSVTRSTPEGTNAVTTQLVFTVVMSGPSEQTITVGFGDEGDTATKADNDYNLAAGVLTFAPSATALQTAQTITVTINGDSKFEANETFSLNLFPPSSGGLTSGADKATITITNDDTAPSVTFTGPTQSEGTSAGNTSFVFTLTLSAISGVPVTVAYSAADGSGANAATAADNDYVASSGTATISVGSLTGTLTVPVVADSKNEANETFVVNLDPDSVGPDEATLNNASATATINNDDPVPTVSISNPTVSEGTSTGNTTPVVFTVTLSNPSGQQVTVAYATADGTGAAAALQGEDYTPTTSSVTFAPNTTTATITVQVTQDSKDEVDETFRILLSNPSNASIPSGQETGTATISDDDGPPAIVFDTISQSEGDLGVTEFVFNITLSEASGKTVTVDFATADNTATSAGGARQDFLTANGALTFAPGVTSQLVTVNVLGDLFDEGNESFFLALENPVNVAVPNAQIAAEILDEEEDNIVFTPSSLAGFVYVNKDTNTTKDTGEKGLGDITVSLSGTSSFSNAPVNLELVTAGDGSFIFGNLEPGTYTVTYQHPSLYESSSVSVGSQGGSPSGLSFTTTIDTLGGITGTDNNLLVGNLKASVISQRSFLSSTVRSTTPPTPPSNEMPEITSVGGATEGFVNAASDESTNVSGTGQAGASVSLVVSDGTDTIGPHLATVASDGTWSLSDIDVSTLDDGTLTYTATVIAPGNASLATKTAVKDTVAPTATSIVREDPTPTNAATVQFTVTFNENVIGVDAGDFDLVPNGVVGAQITGVSGSGTSYTVSVSTGTGSGTLGLDLDDDDSIVDVAGNALGGSGEVNGDVTGQVYTIDKTAPVVSSIVRAAANPTNAASVTYTVTFSEQVVGVNQGDFEIHAEGGITGASIASVSGSGASYTVTVNTGSGDGILEIHLHDDDSITDAAGNELGGTGLGNGDFTGEVYAIDKTAPVVNSIDRAGASRTNAASVQFTATFSESVTGVNDDDFELVLDGVTGAAITGVSGSGTTYAVTVSTGTGDGTLGLNLVDDDSIADQAGNPLGGTGLVNGDFTGKLYTVDKTAPVVDSIVTADPNPTNAASVTYAVTFGEAVVGVNEGDFEIHAEGVITGASITGVSGSGANYAVTVNTGTGSGTLGIHLHDDDSIADAAGSELGGTGLGNGDFVGQVYDVDKTAPTLSSIVRAAANPTNAASVTYTVTFSEAVTGVNEDDFEIHAEGVITGASITSVSGSGANYTVTVDTGTGSGILEIHLHDDDSITDAAGNELGGTGLGNGDFTGEVYAIDKTAPVVNSIDRAGASRTNAASVQFTATFSESVTGVNDDDFELVLDGVTGAAITGVSGSGTTYAVTVSTGTGDGTLGLNLVDDDSIADQAGNPLGGTGLVNGDFTGKLYTVDKTTPVVNSIVTADPNPTTPGSVHYTVTFSESVTGVDAADFDLVPGGDVSDPQITDVSGSGDTYTVTVNTGTGSGTLGLNLDDDDSIVDAAGNPLGGAGADNGDFTGDVYDINENDTLVAPLIDQAMGGGDSWTPEGDPFA